MNNSLLKGEIITMIKLEKMTQDEFNKFTERSLKNYANELIKSGMENELTAYEEAKLQFEKILPDGLKSNDNFLYVARNELYEDVGVIWYQMNPRNNEYGFICDFYIYEIHRRKGYGTQVLTAIEEDAHKHGIKVMVLSVFKYNTPACELYYKVGYIKVKELDKTMYLEKKL